MGVWWTLLPCWWVTDTLEGRNQLSILHWEMLVYVMLRSLPEHWWEKQKITVSLEIHIKAAHYLSCYIFFLLF